jgi:hypothetical protein
MATLNQNSISPFLVSSNFRATEGAEKALGTQNDCSCVGLKVAFALFSFSGMRPEPQQTLH